MSKLWCPLKLWYCPLLLSSCGVPWSCGYCPLLLSSCTSVLWSCGVVYWCCKVVVSVKRVIIELSEMWSPLKLWHSKSIWSHGGVVLSMVYSYWNCDVVAAVVLVVAKVLRCCDTVRRFQVYIAWHNFQSINLFLAFAIPGNPILLEQRKFHFGPTNILQMPACFV